MPEIHGGHATPDGQWVYRDAWSRPIDPPLGVGEASVKPWPTDPDPPDGLPEGDAAFVLDFAADERTHGPIVPEEIAARMRWAGTYLLPPAPQMSSFWAADIALGGSYSPSLMLLHDVLIDTSEWRMEPSRRPGEAPSPVLVSRRRTWRAEVHLYGAVLLWARISEAQRKQARG